MKHSHPPVTPKCLEIWRPVDGYDDIYSISSSGRLRRELGTNASRAGRILSGHLHGRAGRKYIRYTLSKKGISKRYFAHVLVLAAFCGKANGQVPHHVNNDGCDNRVENLRWVTRSENTKYAYADGRIIPLRGEKSSGAKLKLAEVAQMRLRHSLGWTCAMLASAYRIHRSTAHRVVTQRTWF